MKKIVPFLTSITLYANPVEPNVVAGDVSFKAIDEMSLHITTSDKAIIEWKDFSIGEKELTRFIQPSARSTVLNRVTTGNPSQLMGRLEANGHIYLVNPNGIFVGEKASINTNSFFAFNFDVTNDQFLNDQISYPKYDLDSLAVVIQHKGKIDALSSEERNGRVYLVADRGVIEIEGAINCPNGDVKIIGPYIDVKGSIDAAGGGIDVSGSQTFVEKGAVIKADGQERNGGGNIMLWGDRVCIFHGYASAQGGPLGGDGGEIEVSSPGYLDFKGSVSADAPNGKPGMFILDPSTILINAAASSPAFTFPIYNPAVASANILFSDITTALDTGVSGTNVTIRTSAGTGGTGTITIDATATPFTWTKASTLTFEPDANLVINTNVQATGAGNFVVTAGGSVQVTATTALVGLRTNTGNITISAAELQLLAGSGGAGDAQLRTTSGNIVVNVLGDAAINGGSVAGAQAIIAGGAGTVTLDVGGKLTMTSNIGQSDIQAVGTGKTTTVNVAGNFTLNAGGGGAARVNAYNLNFNVGENLSFTTPAVGGNAFFNINNIGDIHVGETISFNNNSSIGCNGPSLTAAAGSDIVFNKGGISANSGNLSVFAGRDILMGGGNFFGNLDVSNIAAGRDIVMFLVGASTASIDQGGDNNLNSILNISVGRDLTLQNNSFIEHEKNGSMNIFVGRNLSLNDTAVIDRLGIGPITIVVDVASSTPPAIGTGSITVRPAASINPFGGPLLIFTAQQSYNSIQGTLAGLSFTPGAEFVNTAKEMWGIYYPHNSGIPFTIFYKNISVAPKVIAGFNNAVFEFLQNMTLLDEFDVVAKPFTMEDGRSSLKKNYQMLRPTVRDINRGKLIL